MTGSKKLVKASWFYNLPSENYAHWGQCALWTLDEAVALSLGADPKFFDADECAFMGDEDRLFVGEYMRRTDLAKRACEAGELCEPIRPGQFLAWAKLRKIDHPKELEDALEAHGHTAVDGMKVLGTRERQSLQKIIYGMAVAKYGYKANGMKSSAVPDICSDLEKQGVGVGNDTVRNVLRAGALLRDRNEE